MDFKTKLQVAAVGVLVVGSALITRSLFPIVVEVKTPPTIVTQYDTVEALDTVWVSKLRTKTEWDTTYLYRVQVDTVYAVPTHPIHGLYALYVPPTVGDTTFATGFTYTPGSETEHPGFYSWSLAYWTGGPLSGFLADTFPPRIMFYDPPQVSRVKPCGSWCKLGHYLVGASVGAGAAALACTVTK